MPPPQQQPPAHQQQQQQPAQASQPATNAGGSSGPAQPPTAAAAKSVWTEHQDKNSGKTFYYNATTRQSVWVKPQELVAAEQVSQSSKAQTPNPKPAGARRS